MNSKEALERILMLARPCAYEVREHRNNYCDMLENAIKQDLDKLEQLEKEKEHYEAIIKRWGEKYHLLEKELLQTKKNFRNSQVHSKNCYKKLKEKYTRLEIAYKNNEVMTKDLNELINRNLELKQENQNLKEVMKNREEIAIELIKAITILKDRRHILKYNGIDGALELGWLTQKEYKLLKEVFESVGGE